MTISALLNDPNWDKPFFKVLASNDTGNSVGHQGGMVIPQALRPFFPGLSGLTSARKPTIDRNIFADLFDGDKFISRVITRYQFQTWGGERSPESRLTSNLIAIRNKATAGDVLVMQRNMLDLELYRLILVRTDAQGYKLLLPAIGHRRWGPLGADAPMSESDFQIAQKEEGNKESAPFTLFEEGARTVESRSISVARSVVFRVTLQRIYENKCSICGHCFRVPNGPGEMHAAHIVPRALTGADDARNGLGFCRSHHWAFDQGLFGIDNKRTVWIPQSVRKLQENEPLAVFAGTLLLEPKDRRLRADNSALKWHMENIVVSN